MSAEQVQQFDGVTWDLTSYFPSFNGPEMQEFKAKLNEDVKTLQEKAALLDTLGADNQEQWEEVILLSEDFNARLGHIYSYVGNLTSAHADNEEYAGEEAALGMIGAEAAKYGANVLAGLKESTDEDFEKFLSREKLKGAEHQLRRSRKKSKFTMEPELEKLAADLGVNGIEAWGRLYDSISGKLEFEMEYPDGKKETLPISQWRSLKGSADREIGRRAFEGGNRAWEKVQTPCAAALNAIAGTRLALNKRRGVNHFLDIALFQASITRGTLDAMMQAIHDNIEIPREIFRAKGKAIGQSGIGFFEREAPLPIEDSRTFVWAEGSGMVSKAFHDTYPALGEYYDSFIEKRWYESQKRPNKRPGAYCTGSDVTGEQRVYQTFSGSLGDISTIAHEIGHAWHGHVLKDFRPMAQHYPMTLAETASTFAEGILSEGIYNDPDISDGSKLLNLDQDVSSAAIFLLDIPVRFEFEKALHEERMKGEVSVSRLKSLMVETQQRIWGDALMEGGEDPMFWASKLHFYITGVTFYNFPYTFGFLLARALYQMFKDEGESFIPKYEDFLRLTGSDTVEGVAKRSLGVDTEDPEFWATSIRSFEEPLAMYKDLIDKKGPWSATGHGS